MEKIMEMWTITMLVLGVLTIGALGAITFAPSPTSSTAFYILMGVIVVVGTVVPIINEKRKVK